METDSRSAGFVEQGGEKFLKTIDRQQNNFL